MKPSSHHDRQTIQTILKTENAKQTLNVSEKSGKKQNKNVDILWEILGIYQWKNTTTKQCMSCLNGKLAIGLHKQDDILNKRTKIISKCRYSNKYNLANYDTKD